MANNYQNQQQEIPKGEMGSFKKLLTSINYCWPFSSAIDITELPILKTIPFTNQRIVTDDENYDIFIFFNSTRRIYELFLKHPSPRKYEKKSKIGFWEFLLYEPYIFVLPKQTLTHQFNIERVFYDQQIRQHINYNYVVTVDYRIKPLNIDDLSDVPKICIERNILENDIRRQVEQLCLAIFGYIYTNPKSSVFNLDDFQGTDIADEKFLSLIQTFQSPSVTRNKFQPHFMNLVVLSSDNATNQFCEDKTNLPIKNQETNTSFQQVKDAKDKIDKKRYLIDHCYVKLESIKFNY